MTPADLVQLLADLRGVIEAARLGRLEDPDTGRHTTAVVLVADEGEVADLLVRLDRALQGLPVFLDQADRDQLVGALARLGHLVLDRGPSGEDVLGATAAWAAKQRELYETQALGLSNPLSARMQLVRADAFADVVGYCASRVAELRAGGVR